MNIWQYGVQTFNNLFRVKKEGGKYFYVASKYNAWEELSYIKAYLELPELNAVISTSARMFGNGVIKEVDDNGTEIDSPLVQKLRNPNWMQNGQEFLRQTKIFRSIFGNEYIYELLPFGMDMELAKKSAIYTIPSNWIKPKYDQDKPYFFEVEAPESFYYELSYRGQLKKIANNNILHFNDDRADMDNVYDHNNTNLTGESKLKALTPALNNLKMAYETRGVLLKNRGALGILSNATSDKIGAIPVDPEERERIQQEYAREYGGLDGQRQLIISSADLRWQQMAISPDKMGLFQETEADFNKILDAYGMPSELFVRAAGATYENQKQAQKGAYINTVIPDANEWISGINSKYRKGAKTKLIMDYMHLTIFQEDLKSKGDALQSNINALSKALQDQVLTPTEYREELAKLGIGDGKEIPSKAEDPNQQNSQTLAAQASLRGSVGGVQGLLSIQTGVSAGTTTYESGLSMLTIIYGFSDEEARQLLGNPK